MSRNRVVSSWSQWWGLLCFKSSICWHALGELVALKVSAGLYHSKPVGGKQKSQSSISPGVPAFLHSLCCCPPGWQTGLPLFSSPSLVPQHPFSQSGPEKPTCHSDARELAVACSACVHDTAYVCVWSSHAAQHEGGSSAVDAQKRALSQGSSSAVQLSI